MFPKGNHRQSSAIFELEQFPASVNGYNYTVTFVVQNGNSSCGEPVIYDDIFLNKLPGSYVPGLQMTTSSR